MFAARYFPLAEFAPAYFPEHGTYAGKGFRGAGKRFYLHHLMLQHARKGLRLARPTPLCERMVLEEARQDLEQTFAHQRTEEAIYTVLLAEV